MVKVALYYRERRQFEQSADSGPVLFSQEFLNAYLGNGTWNELVAVLPDSDTVESFKQTCFEHPSSLATQRRLQWVELRDFLEDVGEKTPARLLHFSGLPDAPCVWARQSTGHHAFAVSGVAHSVASAKSITYLGCLITAPCEPYDRLICTSRSVADVIRAASSAYSDYLRDRHGGCPREPLAVETIPPGVDTGHFRPPTPPERAAARAARNIAKDALVVLAAGGLRHTTHLLAIFESVSRAVVQSEKPVHLLLADEDGFPAGRTAVNEYSSHLARNVRCSLVKGMSVDRRLALYQAADVSCFMEDSVDSTLGLTVAEAMSCGLPVVAADRGGHREVVVDGQTGLLIPTLMVRRSTEDLTVRLLCGEICDEQFSRLAGQGVTIDIGRASEAFARLLADERYRQQLGAAGRRKAAEQYSWHRVITAYERLWGDQLVEREQVAASEASRTAKTLPVCLPPEAAIAPSSWIDQGDHVEAAEGAAQRLKQIHGSPLAGREAESRCADATSLQNVLSAAADGCPLSDLLNTLTENGARHQAARATVAWLLKYNLLRPAQPVTVRPVAAKSPKGVLTFVTTCMGRLSFLKQTLPAMVAQEHCEIVVVDYSCPDGTGDWIAGRYPRVRVVRCPGRTGFHRSLAKNAGVRAAGTPWICLIDADIVIQPGLADRIVSSLRLGEFYRANFVHKGLGGTIVFRRQDFDRVGGHDPEFIGWGEEDHDFCNALQFAGVRERFFPSELVNHLEHDDHARTQFHEKEDRARRWRVNRLYRLIKWDIARLNAKLPTPGERATLYRHVDSIVKLGLEQDIVVDPRTLPLGLGEHEYGRKLVYRA